MPVKNQEILAIIILGAVMGLLLLGFIITIVFLYQKRQQQHKLQLLEMEDAYENQIFKVQFEMQESVLQEISSLLHNQIKNNIDGILSGLRVARLSLNDDEASIQSISKVIEDNEHSLKVIREDIRLTSHSLSQDKLAQVGLLDTLKYEFNFLAKSNTTIHFEHSFTTETKNIQFTQEQSIYLFRLFQEIMGNAIKHSNAKNINLLATVNNDNLFTLTIKDDGIGFNVSEKMKDKNSGIGLLSMKRKATYIQADYDIKSKPNEGTVILLSLKVVVDKNFKKYVF